MKYRKKPIVIEAFQYDGDLKGSDGKYYVPEWAVKAFEEGIIYYSDWALQIMTLEGIHIANVGDYIIQGIKGELYPCKPDIFEATYDKIEEPLMNSMGYTCSDCGSKKLLIAYKQTNSRRIYCESCSKLKDEVKEILW